MTTDPKDIAQRRAQIALITTPKVRRFPLQVQEVAPRSQRPILKKAPEVKLRLIHPKRKSKRNKLVAAETHLGFQIEIYQLIATVGTTKPMFCVYTANTQLNRSGGQKRRITHDFDSLERAMKVARWRIEKRRRQAASHGKFGGGDLTPPRRLSKRYEPPSKTDVQGLDALLITTAESNGHHTTCPVCTKVISRTGIGLHTHLIAHVRKERITPEQK